MTENERIAEIKDAYKEAVDGWAHVYDAATAQSGLQQYNVASVLRVDQGHLTNA